MRLVSLRLVNFRQHADSFLTFDSGLTGIIGPNGAGKSTVLEAVAWALYGNQAARGTRDSIRFVRAAPRSSVRVELEFDLAGHRYRVVRGLTSAEVFLDGASQAIANSITGVGELLQRRLGMSRGEFFNTYFTGQKELNVMAAMGPSERAQFLSRVLGYEKLRAAQTLVRERRRLVVAEIAGLQSGMPDADAVWRQISDAEARLAAARARAEESEARRNETAARLAELAPRWTRAQGERERLQELLGEIRIAEGEEATLARDHDRATRALAEVAAARADLERLTTALAPLDGLRAELKRLDALCNAEGRRAALADSERALAEDVARLVDRAAKLATAQDYERETLAGLEAKRAESESVQASHETSRTAWVRDQQEASTRLDQLRAQFADVQEQKNKLVALGPESPCPTCTRPLGANYTTVLESLEGQLDTLKADGNYYRQRTKQLETEPEEVATLGERRRALAADVTALERRLAKCQAGVQELASVERDLAQRRDRLAAVRADLAALPAGYDAARHALVRREVEALAPRETERMRAEALLAREPQVAADRDRAERALADVRARLAGLRERREALAFSEEEFTTLRASYERTTAESRAAELAAVQAQGDALAARASLDAAERARLDLARMQERLGELQRDKKLHDELDRAYSDLRTDLNFQLRPELSEIASAFLDELTDSRYSELELDDQYNVVVLEDGVPKPVISGGEEDLANLVLRLAISQMIADRAGQSFSLLILDEIFGSLDETRRANVVDLLRRLNDRFEQVILISHIEDVREGLDRVIHVRFDEERGTSVVEVGDDEDDPSTLHAPRSTLASTSDGASVERGAWSEEVA
ncbi:SMC domain protein [Gemmatirosa kalamazoonensis]|uniref:SMC domain protein n=1 Tax=Gemmatirosa kalamazoonensis TaxID=861299 RepID=W0RGM6_9BACT|nr:SMC family ATPase [Gemmatirosa kalamazoonensis]AHG90234.1 SMC domain protein [Gemmatirosa kalamazoonensis]